MDYDPTQEALYHPELQETVFGRNDVSADGIFAELARLAYVRFELNAKEKARLVSQLQLGGLHSCTPFATTSSSTQGFGAIGANGAVYISFRGTQSDDPTDVFTDLDFGFRDWEPGGQVHTGFAEALDSIWDSVLQWLKPHDPATVHFTGHSLGAALATLAASRLPASTLVTFGSPRVGDQEFANIFQQRTVRRYVNCSDVVTQLPPEFLGYVHAGATHYIDQHGIRQNWTETSPGDPIAADRLGGRTDYLLHHAWRRGEVGSRDLADHAPINYVRVFFKP